MRNNIINNNDGKSFKKENLSNGKIKNSHLGYESNKSNKI